MTITNPRARLGELTDHLTGMMDSLDDHVTHDDVYRLLMEAVELSRQRDVALTAVLDLCDRAEDDRRVAQEGSPTTLIAYPVVEVDDLRAAINENLIK